MYRDIDWLLETRAFYLKLFLVSAIVAGVLTVAVFAVGAFTTPETTSIGELVLAGLWGCSMGYVIIFVVMLLHNFVKVGKLRRNIRTWEWQNGQA